MPYRGDVKEYSQDHRAWIQDGKEFRGIKSHKAFIWPKDGRNGSRWGRMKDILQGKGPDIHIAISADKMDYMVNRPSRSRWSDWTCLDDRYEAQDLAMSSAKYAPWTRNCALGGRNERLSYDFRTRRYGKHNKYTWTDVQWQPEPNRTRVYPEAFRSLAGDWYQDEHYIPLTRRRPHWW